MKIIIVGGVAGGATTATRLRRLDENAEIILLEKGEDISFANCGLPYYIGEVIEKREKLLVQTQEKFNKRFHIDVRTCNEAIEIQKKEKIVKIRNHKTNEIYEESYDKLVLSPGAVPIVPPIEIEGKEKVFTLRNVQDTDRIKNYIETYQPKSVTIIGGGYIGVEMAENLVHAGREVNLIEKGNQVIAPLDQDMANFVEQTLKKNSVTLLLEKEVIAIKQQEEKLEIVMETETLQTDMVIFAIGVRPESKLAKQAGLLTGKRGCILVNEKLETSDPNIYALGDAIQIKNYVTGKEDYIPLAGPANRQARIVAGNIMGDNLIYKGTQGSSVLKIFNKTVAMTGINEKTAQRENIPYETVIITPYSHATYYPGAQPLTIKAIFHKKTGQILGAQLIGTEGIDKRADVIATCIRANMNCYDLSDLELCYAPPYSSAKDPVNILGNVMENILENRVEQISYQELQKIKQDKTICILDTRTVPEYERSHIPEAIHIELDHLRENLDQLDPNKTIIVYCHSGLRSYIAYRILKQNGFQVKNLIGGYTIYEINANF